MGKIKVIINTDLGDDVDDSVAIALALNSPEIEVMGITTAFKNTRLRAQMVKDLLNIYHKEEIPVYIGQGMSIIERVDIAEEPLQYSILAGSYDIKTNRSAVDFIIETCKKHPDVYYIEMATQTNLSLAFLKAPDIMKNIKIIGMGGAFLNSFAEWNIKWDPEAARIVTDFAKNMTMFGLDVTKYCTLTPKQLEKIKNSTSKEVKYLYDGMRIFTKKTGYPICLHDAICIAYLIDPSIVVLKKGDYSVELKGERTRGTILHNTNYYDIDMEKNIETLTEKNFQYAVELDVDKFRSLIMNRVFE